MSLTRFWQLLTKSCLCHILRGGCHDDEASRGRMMRRAQRAVVGMAVILVAALVGAGCGSSSKATGSSVAAASDVKAASGPPVRIGFVNQQEGPLAQVAVGDGARAAVKYINSQLNGVDGDVLQLDECDDDGSPEASAKCANQFVADKVPVVMQGLDLGNTGLHPILKAAGIPLVSEEAFTNADYTDGFSFGGATIAYALGAIQFLKTQHVKSAVILTYNVPASVAATQSIIEPGLKAAGITYTPINIDPTTPDFTVPVGAAVASHPGAILTFLQEPDCTKLVEATHELNYDGIVVAGACSQFITAAPADAEGIYTLSDLYNPQDLTKAPAASAAEVRTYVTEMQKLYPSDPISDFTQFPFAGTMNLYAILKELGPSHITSANIEHALTTTQNQPSYMGGTYTCNGKTYSPAPALCGADVLVFKVENGKQMQVTPTFLFGPAIFK